MGSDKPLVDDTILPARLEAFLEHVLGVHPKLAEEWLPTLRELREHQQVKDCLAELSTTMAEVARDKAFATMANFVLDEMHEKYPLPGTAISELRFVSTANFAKLPDIVLVRKDVADRFAKDDTPSVSWTDILCTIGFIYGYEPVPDDTKQEVTTSNSRLRSRASRSGQLETRSPTSAARITAKETAKPHLDSTPTSNSRLVSGSGSGLKRKSDIDLSTDEPPRKKSRSESRSGSVNMGTPEAIYGVFEHFRCHPHRMLSSTLGTREHALCIFISREEMQLWYYDRAGAIHSDTSVNFRTNFVAFATIILALSRLSLQQFGLLSAVKFPSGKEVPTSLEGATLTLRDEQGDEHTVTFTREIISACSGIVGRCSYVFGATCPSISNIQGLVVKYSFQNVTRASEVEFINHARDSGVEYIPTVYLSHDSSRLSHGIRGSLIPMEGETLKYHDRVLRFMVSRRYTPVHKLPSLSDFRSVIRNVFECMYQLYIKARILHRDISFNNIMAEPLTDGSFQGVLNDFDLAGPLDNFSAEGHASLHFTGTLPFMAVELLTHKAVTHTFQHDVESLFYVLVWIAAHYDDNGKYIHEDTLPLWQDGSIVEVRAAKRNFVAESWALDDLGLTDFYAELKAIWLKPLQDIVFRLHLDVARDRLNRLRNPGSNPLVAITNNQLYDDVSAVLRTD